LPIQKLSDKDWHVIRQQLVFNKDLLNFSYLKGSLFEGDFGDESGEAMPFERRETYEIDWDKHVENVTEEKMLERSPALALDLLYHMVWLSLILISYVTNDLP